jgi:hypothetical protein
MTLSSKIELLDKLSKGESLVLVANHYDINDPLKNRNKRYDAVFLKVHLLQQRYTLQHVM